ncbi:hypothetical protein F1D05_27190 [Kribbella qitaiheensis]|uniref:Uncharacterized protein n=1 Tax=Kribbella qitaiheensis TaxID=1544730 RepID=A0A7G6X3W2_9ACTN|nr:hypothetical protein [Kribbella qitaiheensis]QNE20927.1 hypothetical protein F1D05_27190 [Kribbella qitaiheensis]
MKRRIALLIAAVAASIGVLVPISSATAVPIYSIGPYATQADCNDARTSTRDQLDPWYLSACNHRTDGWYFMMSGN